MKKTLFSFILAFSLTMAMAQTTHVITASNTTYTPDSILVSVGDTVEFNVGSDHPTLEVSQATWQANGSTGLSGGFDFPSGNAKLYIDTAKTYYYICTAHISMGMKGRIFVEAGLGTDEIQLKDLEIYPNPVSEYLVFTLKADPDIRHAQIMNVSGKVVQRISLNKDSDRQEANVSLLKSGTYILRVEHGNTLREVRFVKK